MKIHKVNGGVGRMLAKRYFDYEPNARVQQLH